MSGSIKNNVLVLIPNYNSGANLLKTISSIDSSEFADVLIVDDGSSLKPEIEELRLGYGGQGEIFLELLPNNQGIVGALNYGVKYALSRNYKYIARLDSGDLNVGKRLRIQEQFLENNPGCGLVGSWVDFIDEDGQRLFVLKHPESYQSIKKVIYRYNPFVHPATMIRLTTLKEVGGYPDMYPALEDWACFLEISKRYEVRNLPLILLKYEVSSSSISTKKRFQQSISKVRLLKKNYRPNMNQTIGLLKNILILIFPRGLLTGIKRILWR